MASQTRSPRATVTLGGKPVACLDVTVTQVKTSEASTFSAKIPLQVLEAAGIGLDWLSSQTSIDASVSMSTDGSAGTTLITGGVDKATVEFSPSGQVVSISGRDATSKMTDVKTNEKFVNQKSEDIARTIAGRHGLGFQSDGGTVTAGSIYTEEQAKVTGNQSEWTLLRQLAQNEGKIAFVMGSTLYFQAPSTSGGTFPVLITPATPGAPAASNANTVSISRNYQVAAGATVTFNAWDYKKQQLITSTASAGGGIATYVYNDHQLTQEQADKAAPAKLAEIMRHAASVTITMPGDPTLSPLQQIALSGTGSGFDQSYDIDSVTHSMRPQQGYAMSIAAKVAGS